MNTYCFKFYFLDSDDYDYDYVRFVRAETLNSRIFNVFRSIMRESGQSDMVILKNNEYVMTYSEPLKFSNEFSHYALIEAEIESLFYKNQSFVRRFYYEGNTIQNLFDDFRKYMKPLRVYRIKSVNFETGWR